MIREWLLQMGHTNIRDPYIRDCEPASVLQNSQFKIHDSRFAIDCDSGIIKPKGGAANSQELGFCQAPVCSANENAASI